MLDQLIEIVTSDHVSAIAIVAGGTGYAIDDIITFSDGTFTHAATARVTSVAAGVIDGIQMEVNGAYTVDPDLTANTSHTNSGAGNDDATFDLTMESDRWTIDRHAQEAVSATLATAGTGYTVGDQLTLSMNGGGIQGATGHGTDYGVLPVFEVATISGGGGTGPILTVTLVTAGNLEQVPDVDVGTGGFQADVTGGTGASAVLTVTYQDPGAAEEDLVIFNAPGEGGSDDIRMAIRTQRLNDVTNFFPTFSWQLFGLVEYNAALALQQQVNLSPGIDAGDGERTSRGTYIMFKEADSDPDMTFWMSITNRRMILVVKLETATTTHYASMYLGLLNAFTTTAIEPYPMWVQGCSTRDNAHWGDTETGRITGLSDMYAVTTGTHASNPGTNPAGDSAPAFYRARLGEWSSFKNSNARDDGSPSRTKFSDFTSWPCGIQTYTNGASADQHTRLNFTGLQMDDIIPATGVPGVATVKWRPTPNTGDDIRPLLPITPMATDDTTFDTYFPLGELDNVFWLSASDATTDLTSEDVQKDGDVRYMVFQNGNATEEFNYFALKVG